MKLGTSYVAGVLESKSRSSWQLTAGRDCGDLSPEEEKENQATITLSHSRTLSSYKYYGLAACQFQSDVSWPATNLTSIDKSLQL